MIEVIATRIKGCRSVSVRRSESSSTIRVVIEVDRQLTSQVTEPVGLGLLPQSVSGLADRHDVTVDLEQECPAP